MWKGRRVLVTGNTGFKGRWLCAALQKSGARVVGYSLSPSESKVSSEHENFSPFVEAQHYGDVADRGHLESVIEVVKPEVIFHLAANAIVSRCFEDPIGAYISNCIGTLTVLEVVRSLELENLDLILVTSDKVYENVGWQYGYREIDKLGADDIYSGSKSAAELGIKSFVNAYRDHFVELKVRITVARAGNVIGGGDFSERRLIPDIIKGWYSGRSIELRNPLATRPWQHVLDVARGYMLLAENSRMRQDFELGEEFNFGPSDSDSVTVEEVVNYLESNIKIINPAIKTSVNILQTHLGWKEQSLLALSPVKSAQKLNWVTTLSLQESLRLTVEWFNSHFDQGFDLTAKQVETFFEVLDK